MLWTLPACAHHPAPPSGAVVALDEAGLAALIENRGEAVRVVNFWATWCVPCVEEIGQLAAIAQANPSVTFDLVSVDDARDAAFVRRFVADRALTLRTWHLQVPDPPASLARVVPAWPDLIPVTLVLEGGGEVRARFDGTIEAPALTEALR